MGKQSKLDEPLHNGGSFPFINVRCTKGSLQPPGNSQITPPKPPESLVWGVGGWRRTARCGKACIHGAPI